MTTPKSIQTIVAERINDTISEAARDFPGMTPALARLALSDAREDVDTVIAEARAAEDDEFSTYDEALAEKCDRDAAYETAMRDAGRGHLLGGEW